MFRELCSNFTTRISPFYDDITIDVGRGVRQGDTVSLKLFTATLEDVTRRLEWDNMGVRVDNRLLHNLCFADDIVQHPISVKRGTYACRLRRHVWKDRSPTEFIEDNVHKERMGPGCPILAQRNDHLRVLRLRMSRSGSQHDDLAPELGRRKRAAWGAYKSTEDVVKKTKSTRLHAHLFNTTLPIL
ncbi:hypothetical protein ANCCEY_12993 [Ancylostoma ceylanicum]|uniref:Reverse transcriptase domain-containing protein n=1 Tax=Ancylostoma ceylanicum TaxID=53326 RepID=A0A0D6L817_9BILA|nr:hypothetical protein ANCCEY_12993 [Ancylostoma ceylanicum]